MSGGAGTPPVEIRRARPDEFDRLLWVELESDRLLAAIGIGPFTYDNLDQRTRAVVVFASGEPVVGFVSVELVDDEAHIAQLSVLPELGRRGIGGALLDEAVSWARGQALEGVTLTPFRDVPWNAPVYA